MKNLTLDESAKYFCEKRTSFNGRATTLCHKRNGEQSKKGRIKEELEMVRN
jgi:hypothetical protein